MKTICERAGPLSTLILISILLAASVIEASAAAGQLTISAVSVNDNGTIRINGTVTDENQQPVAGVKVSIQVNDPQGKTAHLEFTYTNQEGKFEDTFTTPEGVDGEYTVYVTASKSGYENGSAVTTFTAIPEFSAIYLIALLSLALTLSILKRPR
ncbi:MAG: carboxypeptidase-like regulatory domain-containing protein [Candidatus Bathyarchaeia archaeon]